MHGSKELRIDLAGTAGFVIRAAGQPHPTVPDVEKAGLMSIRIMVGHPDLLLAFVKTASLLSARSAGTQNIQTVPPIVLYVAVLLLMNVKTRTTPTVILSAVECSSCAERIAVAQQIFTAVHAEC